MTKKLTIILILAITLTGWASAGESHNISTEISSLGDIVLEGFKEHAKGLIALTILYFLGIGILEKLNENGTFDFISNWVKSKLISDMIMLCILLFNLVLVAKLAAVIDSM